MKQTLYRILAVIAVIMITAAPAAVRADVDDYPIIGRVENEYGKPLYIIDHSKYVPDAVTWDHLIVRGKYQNDQVRYISDQDKNVKILYLLSIDEKFTPFAFTDDFKAYPVMTCTDKAGNEYLCTSILACAELDAGLFANEETASSVLYAIDSSGHGSFLKLSSGGVLIPWDEIEPETPAETSPSDNSGFEIPWLVIIVAACAAALAVIIFVAVSSSRKQKKEEELWQKRQEALKRAVARQNTSSRNKDLAAKDSHNSAVKTSHRHVDVDDIDDLDDIGSFESMLREFDEDHSSKQQRSDSGFEIDIETPWKVRPGKD